MNPIRFALMALGCFAMLLGATADSYAGFGFNGRSVQRVVVRQQVVRQRVVVQQQVVAQPVVVAQQFYAQPIVSQQIIAQPLQFYSQPLVSQQLVQPSCGSQQFFAPQQFRQSISGGGCSSFFAR